MKTLRNVDVDTRRRVSRLTDEELQKKRAIDRDNQRYHRAKTRAYIASLEKQVADLTFRLQETQKTLSQYHDRWNGQGSGESSSPLSSSSVSSIVDAHSLPAYHHHVPALPVKLAESNVAPGGVLKSMPLQLAPGITLDLPDETPGFSLLELGLPEYMTSNVLAGQEMALYSDNQQKISDSATFWVPGQSQYELSGIPEWQRLPLHLPPTTKLDEVIVNTAQAWRQQALHFGHQEAELNDPAFPNISSLLNRTNEACHLQPLSIVVADQVGRSPVTPFPERLGFMYILSYFIRWLVCRTAETYDSLPGFLKPTHLQRTVPHPPWIDIIAWPAARDCIIRGDMDWSQFDTFRGLSGPTLSVEWPYHDSDTVLECADGRLLMLNPVFVSHISRVENWKVGEEVAHTFPFMLPFCKSRRKSSCF